MNARDQHRRLDNLDSVPFRYIKHEQSDSEFQGVMNIFEHPFTCMITGPSGCGKTF